MDNFIEIAERITKFNKLNEKKKGHTSFVHITSLEEYSDVAPNGAVCALNFHECIHGTERNSKFEFASYDKLLNYLRQHT